MSDRLLDEVLANDISGSVDFEITFAAFLATGLLANPSISPPLRIPTYVSALLLLFLTLIRRMAVINRFAQSDKILKGTTPFLVVLSTYSGLYFALALGTYSAKVLPLSPLLLALIYIFTTCLLSVVLYEVYFRDFMLVMALYSYAQYRGTIENTKYGEWVLESIQGLLSISMLGGEDFPPEIEEIRSATNSPDKMNRWEKLGANLGVKLAVLLMPLFFATAGLLFVWLLPSNSILGGIGTFVLGAFSFLCVNYLLVWTRFLYGRYGVMRFGDLSSVRYTIYLSAVLYLMIAIYINYLYNLGILPF